MAFCINCGQELADGANFCGNCGKAVRPANKSQVEIQEIYAGRNKRTQSCHFASAIKDGGSP